MEGREKLLVLTARVGERFRAGDTATKELVMLMENTVELYKEEMLACKDQAEAEKFRVMAQGIRSVTNEIFKLNTSGGEEQDGQINPYSDNIA